MLGQRFEIIEHIAKTPTSEVIKALDKKRRKVVAIKTVHKSRMRPIELLRREFETLTYLDHPNIVRVYDFGDEPDYIYYTMDYYGGPVLYRSDSLTDLPDLFDFSLQLLSALDYVHRRGIIHGDVKPSNIFEDAAFAKKKFILGDFGLARFVESENLYPVSGTMEYIAPEVFQGVSNDPRSDLYSFGIMFFRIIASCLPFLPGDDISKIKRKATYQYLRLSEVVPEVYPELDEYAAGFIQHNPADRFVSAYEALTALAELAKKLNVSVPGKPYLDNDLATGKFFQYQKKVEEITKEGAGDESRAEVFFLEGTEGSGKTSLMKEAGKVAQLKGGLFLYVDCSGGAEALSSLWKELAELTGEATREDPAGASDGDLLENAIVGRRDVRFAMEQNGLRTLSALGEGYDLSIIGLDNVDPGDEELAVSIARLLNHARNGGVKYVVAYRGPLGGPAVEAGNRVLAGSEKGFTCRKFALKGFTSDVTEEYLKYVLGVTALDPSLLRCVHDKGGGNPGVIRRMVEMMAADKVILRGLDGWHIDYDKLRKFRVPAAANDYFADVVGRLDHRERDALALAAAYGVQFPESLVEDRAALGRLVKSGVVAKAEGIGSGYSFANAALHHSICETVGGERLGEASRKVLDYFEANPPRALVGRVTRAQTFLRIGDLRRARESYLDAARAARAERDYEQAIELLETALATEGGWDSRSYEKLVSDLADSYGALGDHRGALRNYELVVEMGGERREQSAETILKIAKERLGLGDYEWPATELRALAARDLTLDERFQSNALLAWAFYGLKDFGLADAYARAAENIADSMGRKIPAAYIKYIKGVVFHGRGDYDSSLAEFRQAARLAEEAGNPRLSSIARNIIAEVLVWNGDFNGAEEAATESVKLAREAGDRYAVVAALGRLGQIYFRQGYVDRAQQQFDTAEAECKTINDKRLLASVYVSASANMIRAGEYRKAEFYLDLAETSGAELGLLAAYVQYNRALLCCETAQFDRSFKNLAAAEEMFMRQLVAPGVSEVRALRGRASYHKGDYGEAERILTSCLRTFEDAGDKFEFAKVVLTLGEIALARGELDVAEPYLDQALARFQSLKNKYFVAQTYFARAKLKLELFRGSQSFDIMGEAERDLENAKDMFKEIGVDKYRTRIFELEGELFMAKRPEQKGQERLADLAAGLKKLSGLKNLDELLKYILTYLTKELGADRGVVFLFDEHKNMLRIKGTAGVDDPTIEDASAISQTIIGQVAGSRKGLLSPNAAEDFRFKDSHSVHLHRIRSLMCIPLATAENFLGVIYLDSLERGDLFADEDLTFAQIFAQNAAYEVERRQEMEKVRAAIARPSEKRVRYGRIVGSSPGVKEILARVETAARNPIDVLVVGDSGTGKELVAKMIHYEGINADKPFIGINCGAIPETLLESELFGIEKGTATGVDKRIGLFERAGEGTIFLDEVGAMSMSTQAKFLRVLQERQFFRLGSGPQSPIQMKARVISATNADLPRAIEEGTFRDDLFYRLNVYMINCPPLREHKEDIPELLDYFITTYYRGDKKGRPSFSAESMDLLMSYDWPGNVRELENCVRYAIVNSPGATVEAASLPKHIVGAAEKAYKSTGASLNDSVARLEREMILNALRESGWVKSKAARNLDISETNLRYKMKKYGISEKERFPIA
jgi:Nif-specific regulatory protein